MASRFTLPHIDISRFRSSHEYQGPPTGGGAGVRDRIAHGQRVQRELAAALAFADALRPAESFRQLSHHCRAIDWEVLSEEERAAFTDVDTVEAMAAFGLRPSGQ